MHRDLERVLRQPDVAKIKSDDRIRRQRHAVMLVVSMP
jgi:hypothetical protein